MAKAIVPTEAPERPVSARSGVEAGEGTVIGARVCIGCKKEPAEDDLYCWTCSKVRHDIEIDNRN